MEDGQKDGGYMDGMEGRMGDGWMDERMNEKRGEEG